MAERRVFLRILLFGLPMARYCANGSIQLSSLLGLGWGFVRLVPFRLQRQGSLLAGASAFAGFFRFGCFSGFATGSAWLELLPRVCLRWFFPPCRLVFRLIAFSGFATVFRASLAAVFSVSQEPVPGLPFPSPVCCSSPSFGQPAGLLFLTSGAATAAVGAPGRSRLRWLPSRRFPGRWHRSSRRGRHCGGTGRRRRAGGRHRGRQGRHCG